MSLVLGLGLERSCPWPREVLSSKRLSLALALASDFFRVLGLGLGLEPCVLDSTSGYGPTNNIYSDYFDVEPWQVDWLVVVQSVIFLAISFPMTILTSKMGYRLSVLLITTTLTAGFLFTTLGVIWRSTFGIILFGQAIMGFSNIVSWSIPPATAAIWFPENEVATAVATQVVGRGVGEAIGSLLPTILLKDDSTPDQVS